MVRLDNSNWGFASNCFVCEQTNASGLQIPFFYHEEAGVVRAEFSLDERFSGAPSYVHGGLTLAVLDEAMAWATIAICGTFALTHTTTTTFVRPMKVGRPYVVEARITERADESDDGSIGVAGLVSRGTDGKSCAEAQATFTPLSTAQAGDAIGTDVQGTADAAYLKG